MNFFKKWFQRKKVKETAGKGEEHAGMGRENINMHDKYQREKYVTTCLEQIAESSREMENLEYEYNLVTAYLTDIEEIENMAPEDKSKLVDFAKQIVKLEDEKDDCQGKINRMTDIQYQHMERIEDDVPEALKKIKDTEEYQAKIKQDLNRLDGEKQAYQYRAGELETGLANLKGIIMICISSLIICAVILAVLHFGMMLDVRLGYVVVVAIAAAALTVVFVKNGDTQKELLKVKRAVNKIILLQNTVKIRYVNNTNLLEYLYLKYDINNSSELSNLWDRYLQEKEDRAQFRQVQSELEYCCGAVLKILRRYKVQDPNIWIHQAIALYDSKEMVEIRHSLIIRRQKLRKQIEYNTQVAQNAQDEVKQVVEGYPQYAEKILTLVSEYEKALA